MEDEEEEKMEKWKMKKWKWKHRVRYVPPPGPLPRTLHCNAGARGLTPNRTTNSSDRTGQQLNDESPLSRVRPVSIDSCRPLRERGKKGQSTKKSPKPARKRRNPAGRDSWENLPSTTT